MKNILGIINLHENEDMLSQLTRSRPLAAVPFGGRFRVIDFILSNMVNSGIYNVGVIVKEQYRSLMDHLRSGKEWDLARKRDGLFVLPPPDHIHYSNSIYRGDLEYFHHHIDFLKNSTQDYVLIACSHMLYNVNFSKAFEYHLDKKADITVLYKEEIPNPGKSFSHATLVTVDENGMITDMHVKSSRVAGGNISLEAFIVSKELLLRIIEDCVARGGFDLVKEGIIKNIGRYSIYGFPFGGYVANIASIQSYFRVNMDLLDPAVWEELFNQSSPIYTRVKDEAPANYRENATVSNSLIANGCVIEGKVENSILFRGVKVNKGAYVKNSIIMQKSEIGPNALLENVICDKNVKVTDSKRLVGDRNYVMVIEKGMVI